MFILLGKKSAAYVIGAVTMLIFTSFQGVSFAYSHQLDAIPPKENVKETEIGNPIKYAAVSPTPTPTPEVKPTEPDVVSFGVSVAQEQQSQICEEVSAMIEEAAFQAQLSEYFTEDDIIMVAQLIHAEAGAVYPLNRRAAVAWTVCNRIDNGYSSSRTTISAVIKQPGQYAWYSGCSYSDLDYAIAEDVLTRWATEQITGEVNEGRVLPSEYMFFWGDGSQNHFNDGKGNYWDYSVEYDPYEDWE